MAKKNKNNPEKTPSTEKSWIPMRTGIGLIAILSVLLGVWVGWQAVPIKGLFEGILWGAFFGGSIWIVFLAVYLFQRLFR